MANDKNVQLIKGKEKVIIIAEKLNDENKAKQHMKPGKEYPVHPLRAKNLVDGGFAKYKNPKDAPAEETATKGKK